MAVLQKGVKLHMFFLSFFASCLSFVQTNFVQMIKAVHSFTNSHLSPLRLQEPTFNVTDIQTCHISKYCGSFIDKDLYQNVVITVK